MLNLDVSENLFKKSNALPPCWTEPVTWFSATFISWKELTTLKVFLSTSTVIKVFKTLENVKKLDDTSLVCLSKPFNWFLTSASAFEALSIASILIFNCWSAIV